MSFFRKRKDPKDPLKDVKEHKQNASLSHSQPTSSPQSLRGSDSASRPPAASSPAPAAPLFASASSTAPAPFVPPNSSFRQDAAPAQPHPPSNVVYPWSLRPISLLPPALLPDSPSQPMSTSPMPFPRYGHSVNPLASSSTGDLYVFGGLIGDQVRNDLFVLQCAPQGPNSSMQVGLVETKGEIPGPRVGHASVGVGNVLIVWGGDTKIESDDIQDPGLYLLNLSTREWKLVKATGAHPCGRYGHAAAMIGSRFFVFGGQKEDVDFIGGVLNDLWSFDLQKLKDGSPRWDKVEPAAGSPSPPRRMGHTVVTYEDCLYVFGGTCGRFHYNDTWKFDTSTLTWTELSCHGYIPLQREGHSATLVDDVMYVLGGRGTDGMELDDLAAFKITNHRWYMFQNMGPAPAGRSGHAMATWQNKVFVLGGESFTGPRKDDPKFIHVLDTKKIKYPPDTSKPPAQSNSNQNLTDSVNGRSPPQNESPQGTPPDAVLRAQAGSPSLQQQRALSPFITGDLKNSSQSILPAVSQNIATRPSGSPKQQQQANGNTSSFRANSPSVQQQLPNNAQRPKRANEQASESINNDSSTTIRSTPTQQQQPTQNSLSNRSLGNTMDQSQQQQQSPPSSSPERSMSPRVMSPPPERNTSAAANTRPRRPSEVNGTNFPQQQNISSLTTSPASNNLAAARSPSPKFNYDHNHTNSDAVSTNTSNNNNINDAYYFGSSSNININSLKHSNNTSQTSSTQAKWLASALAIASQKGFALPDVSARDKEEFLAKSSVESLSNDPQKKALLEALLSLKREVAKNRTTLSEQMTSVSDRLEDANRSRAAAQHEAAYYRSKLQAIESGSAANINKVERDRISDLERRLASVMKSQKDFEQRASVAETNYEREKQRRLAAEERETQANQQADAVETKYSRSLTDYADLQRKSQANESMLRNHLEQIDHLSSSLERTSSEHSRIKGKMESTEASVDQYLRTLEQTQATLTAANAQADEMEALWTNAKAELADANDRVAQLQSELDAKTSECSHLSTKCEELERILRVTKDEVGSMRSLTTSGLSELLEHTKKTRSLSDGGVIDDEHLANLRNAENELDTLRTRHEETKSQANATQQDLQEAHSRITQLEQQCSTLRSELSSIRRLHADTSTQIERHKASLSSREAELRKTARSHESAQVKLELMRSVLADNGLVMSDEEIQSAVESSDSSDASAASKIAKLTSKIHELEDQLEKGGSTIKGHSSNNSSSTDPSRSKSPEAELQGLQERHRHLEAAHVKAVSFVKGSEKMLRRMKEEVNKHKERNEELEGQLAEQRSGRVTPSKAMMGDLDALKQQMADLRNASDKANNENDELQRRMLTLQAEYDRTLQQQETEASTKYESLEAELESCEREKDKFHSELAQVQSDLTQTLALNKQLTEQLRVALKGNSNNSNNGSNSSRSPEITKLETDLQAADNRVEWLKRENAALEARCRESESKISILLDAWQGRDNMSASPMGDHSRSASHDSTQELEPWSKPNSKGEPQSATNPSEESSIFSHDRYTPVKTPNGVHSVV